MSWSGHWHGYGPWTGSRDTYGQEGLRRPGANPNDEQTRSFLSTTMPPMMTGHWLLRRSQTAADRTWTDVGDAMTWLKTTYESNPPFKRDDGKQAYAALDTKIVYAMDVLPRGVDVTWAHYTESSSLTSFTVVCCPNQFHPEIACPMPPN